MPEDRDDGHSFTFSHSGFIGRPTPEQQAVIDRLKAGELTPEQAAEQLGGKVHQGGFELHLSAGGEDEPSGVEPPSPVVREFTAGWGWALPLVLALLALLGVVVWVTGDLTKRNHVLTSVFVSVVAFAALAGLASPRGLARFTGAGRTTSSVGLTGGSIGALAIFGWGLALTAVHRWSWFVPGVVVIALATGVLVAVLLSFAAAAATRSLRDDLDRRRH